MMKKDLHVFGIGNGIVDLQLTIEQEAFEKLALRKGGMMLVGEAEQRAILEQLPGQNLHRCSGGSAANTIIAFAQMGGKAGFGTRLGKDEFGDFYAREFKELGIEIVAPFAEDSLTGTCVVLITPDAERTLNTSLGANLAYSKHDLDTAAVGRSEWLYIEGYKLTESNGAEAIMEAVYAAKKHDTKVAISVSDTFIPQVFGEPLKELAAHADLIFCNESEAQAFTGTDSTEAAFAALKSSKKNIALTLGAAGSKVYFQGNEYSIPSFETTPKDTTGAGDMYAAGFLYGITHGYSPEQAGKAGAFSASRVIARLGARLPDAEISTVKSTIFAV